MPSAEITFSSHEAGPGQARNVWKTPLFVVSRQTVKTLAAA